MEAQLGGNYQFKVDLMQFVAEAENIDELVSYKLVPFLLKMKFSNTFIFYRKNKQLILKLQVLRQITVGHFDVNDLRAKWIKTLQSIFQLR